MVTEPTKFQFDIETYYQLAELNIIPHQRIELIHGEIIRMSPAGSKHAACVKKIAALFSKILKTEYIMGVQDPVRLSTYSEPEPDISILRYKEDFYASAHPSAEDILLVVEVADSSLEYDRKVKAKLYAEANIEEYLLINLENREVEVFTSPKKGIYTKVEIFDKGSFTVMNSFTIDVFKILP